MNNLEWFPLKGFEGNYLISKEGYIKSLLVKERILKPSRNNHHEKYMRVRLKNLDGKWKSYLVHRLVATTFIPNPLGKEQVNHIDENPFNNHVDNLEWATQTENSNHGTAIARTLAKTSKPVNGVNLETGEEVFYKSISESKKDGFRLDAVSRCCKGIYRQHSGYTFIYMEV